MEKALERLDGVKKADVSDWRKAEGLVFLQEGMPFNPTILEKAIKDAGFTPTWMEVKAAGILRKKNNSLILQIEEIPQEFILIGDKTRGIAKFTGNKIVVTGNVQEEEDHLKISVKMFGLEEKWGFHGGKKMMELEELEFKVEGMVRRGNIVWMGWPDSIKTDLEGLEQIEQVEYILEEEKFPVKYQPSKKVIEKILDTIKSLGKERSCPYEPSILPP